MAHFFPFQNSIRGLHFNAFDKHFLDLPSQNLSDEHLVFLPVLREGSFIAALRAAGAFFTFFLSAFFHFFPLCAAVEGLHFLVFLSQEEPFLHFDAEGFLHFLPSHTIPLGHPADVFTFEEGFLHFLPSHTIPLGHPADVFTFEEGTLHFLPSHTIPEGHPADVFTFEEGFLHFLPSHTVPGGHPGDVLEAADEGSLHFLPSQIIP